MPEVRLTKIYVIGSLDVFTSRKKLDELFSILFHLKLQKLSLVGLIIDLPVAISRLLESYTNRTFVTLLNMTHDQIQLFQCL